jgi:uncharacterized membrane protein YdbT with pleckstrin-like domain
MSYIQDNLLPGEHIVYKANLHKIIFFWPAFWLVISIVLFPIKDVGIPLGAIILLLSLILGTKAAMKFISSEFGVTNKRVLIKVGLIQRKSFETMLTKIEGIQVNQGILGRILNYGTIVVTGTGGSKEPFHSISSPLEFRKKVQEQVSRTQEAKP